ncbi:MAG: HEAT repeat domain-containing protein [Gammaproteobacteria bacterium]
MPRTCLMAATACLLMVISTSYSNKLHAETGAIIKPDESAVVDIMYSSQGYSVSATQATLGTVLQQLSKSAKFKLKLFDDISAEQKNWLLHSMPLTRLLENLTRGYSTVMLYEEEPAGASNNTDRKIKEMWVIARDDNQGSDEITSVNIEIVTEQNSERMSGYQNLTAEQQYEIAFIDNLEGMAGSDIVDTLQQTLADEADPLVRKRAVTALGDIGGTGVLDALETSMGDSSSDVRTELAKTLAGIKDQRSMLLLGQILMGDTNSQVRQQAVSGLYQQNTPAARSFVEAAATDRDPAVKKIADDILQLWLPATEKQ